VFLNFPLGHQTGKPRQSELQLQIVREAMAAFATIDRPGTIIELPYVWDPKIAEGRRPTTRVALCRRVLRKMPTLLKKSGARVAGRQ
jgi:hypothetical protein